MLKLAVRSLLHYRRINAGVLLSVVFGTAVLIGAMLVGDSVRFSLARNVDVRLGRAEIVLMSNDRFFKSDLAQRLSARLKIKTAPVLYTQGLIVNPDNNKRVNQVNIYGVDDRFFDLAYGQKSESPVLVSGKNKDSLALNAPLAERLNIQPGSDAVIRIAKPSIIPRDVPVTGEDESSVGIRLSVSEVAGEEQFGSFSLQANLLSPMNVFVPIGILQERIEQADKANMILLADGVDIDSAGNALNDVLDLQDIEIEVREIQEQNLVEIRSRRVFIDEFVSDISGEIGNNGVSILTYFVNEIEHENKTTPYSMVTTSVKNGDLYEELFPDNLKADDIVINQWLADDLQADIGDDITLKYYVIGPNREIREDRHSFKVGGIVPLEGVAADTTMMPDFPGLADVDNCRQWKPGVEVDLDKIRPKDEKYWDDYRGTPKAFIQNGYELWKNRFGRETSIRYPSKSNSVESVTENLLGKIEAGKFGFNFIPVRQIGDTAGKGSSDFGSLFMGLSMFLIGSAVVLIAMVFVFGVERRLWQAGILMAVGYRRPQVKRMFLLEGMILSIAGSIIGAACGMAYTKLMLLGLDSIWSGAVTGLKIYFHASDQTMITGTLSGIIISIAAVYIVSRKHLRQDPIDLIHNRIDDTFSVSNGRIAKWIGIACLVLALLILGVFSFVKIGAGKNSPVGIFFGIGSLLLIAGIAFSSYFLSKLCLFSESRLSDMKGLAFRNMLRKRSRSIAVIALFACGIFMVVAVGSNQKDPLANADKRSSGTGGFALYGQSAIGITNPIDTVAGQKSLALDGEIMKNVAAISMRLKEGDDASCFNLNRAQKPGLLGVKSDRLKAIEAFKFKGKGSWDMLRSQEDDVVPAVGDYPTVYWALGKNIGDQIEYIDEKGRPFKVQIIAMINSSILQGRLLIEERSFIERFPSVSGHRVFLIDAPVQNAEKISDHLSDSLRDYGMDVVPAWKRLAEFGKVESTYLSIFQLLGGLGILVGTVGLGLMVSINILERRSELAMLRAVGYERTRIMLLVVLEHAWLLIIGILIGVITALISVAPSIVSAGSRIPYIFLGSIIITIALSGIFWIYLAARMSMKGTLVDSLRNE